MSQTLCFDKGLSQSVAHGQDGKGLLCGGIKAAYPGKACKRNARCEGPQSRVIIHDGLIQSWMNWWLLCIHNAWSDVKGFDGGTRRGGEEMGAWT
jgi:hypothetical protein